jgi:hypothetical protein
LRTGCTGNDLQRCRNFGEHLGRKPHHHLVIGNTGEFPGTITPDEKFGSPVKQVQAVASEQTDWIPENSA